MGLSRNPDMPPPAWKKHLRRYRRQKPKDKFTRRYFLDGTHPVWGVELVHCRWLLRGQRFHVGVGGGRKRLNILGAICPQDHEYLDVLDNLDQYAHELKTLLSERFQLWPDEAWQACPTD